jgi:hypothetical protein
MKRGAFELSLTTIVVLVIAVVMLILGLIFIKKIMCGGMLIAEETLQGARNQIAKLFGESGGEIRCMGSAGTNPPTIVPGRANAIGCNYYPETTNTYTFNVMSAQFTPIGGQSQNVMNWFITTKHTKTVAAGSSDVGGVIVRPPKGTSTGTLTVKIKITAMSGPYKDNPYEEDLTFEVKTLGFLRENVC